MQIHDLHTEVNIAASVKVEYFASFVLLADNRTPYMSVVYECCDLDTAYLQS